MIVISKVEMEEILLFTALLQPIVLLLLAEPVLLYLE